MADTRNAYKILVGRPEGKGPLRRFRHRWEKIVWEGVDWIHLAQHKDQWWAHVNTVMNLQVP
jgi:hypothetical protein